jgi:threonine dehydratase
LDPVLDDFLAVPESALRDAMRLTFDHLRPAVEPAGAAGVAAAMTHEKSLRGELVATMLCGGNVAREPFFEWIEAP